MPLTGPGTANHADFRRADKDTGIKMLAATLVLSALLLFFGVRDDGTGPLSKLRWGFQTVTAPVRYVGGLVGRPVDALSNVIANLTADQETLAELKQLNLHLTARNAELEEEAASAARFEALLELKNTYNLESTGARVISSSSDTWADTITIDKGSSSGIAVGMPVTDSQAVIGQVIECSASTSTVRLLTDENSSVSAMVQSSRAQGILRGSADGTLRLALIRADQTVKSGDTVITSGLGGAFPKGLLLGRVVSAERAAGSLYYDVVVEQYASVESFEEVLVITAIHNDQQASAEDIAEADKQDSEGISSADDAQKTESEGGESETVEVSDTPSDEITYGAVEFSDGSDDTEEGE